MRLPLYIHLQAMAIAISISGNTALAQSNSTVAEIAASVASNAEQSATSAMKSASNVDLPALTHDVLIQASFSPESRAKFPDELVNSITTDVNFRHAELRFKRVTYSYMRGKFTIHEDLMPDPQNSGLLLHSSTIALGSTKIISQSLSYPFFLLIPLISETYSEMSGRSLSRSVARVVNISASNLTFPLTKKKTVQIRYAAEPVPKSADKPPLSEQVTCIVVGNVDAERVKVHHSVPGPFTEMACKKDNIYRSTNYYTDRVYYSHRLGISLPADNIISLQLDE